MSVFNGVDNINFVFAYFISSIVNIADTISASRPGARNDSSENYFQRLEKIENIGNEIKGVDKAYAIQAGRELRVIVKPEEIDDLMSYQIARNIKDKIETEVATITEPGLKELLFTAIQKHKSPYPEDQKDAVEKIWDAFERLKSYYATKKEEKRQSIDTIVTDISGGEEYFKQLFDKEIRTLTEDIGNACHIRHSEVWQVDITDIRHYDYFYNRCLSLIALAIQYLRP